MDRQPVLTGERLALRPLAETDRTALTDISCDELLWAQHPVPERAEPQFFDTYFDHLLDKGGALAVIDRTSATFIGSSSFSNHRAAGRDAVDGVVEIGSTFLARSHWGGAANRELKRLMLGHAFGSVALVEFLIGADNHRSRAAIAKIGARLTDRIVDAQFAGRDIPHLVYEIMREDFARGPLANP